MTCSLPKNDIRMSEIYLFSVNDLNGVNQNRCIFFDEGSQILRRYRFIHWQCQARGSNTKNVPHFPDRLTPVTTYLKFGGRADEVVYYFMGLQVFFHPLNDVNTLHMINAQFCVKGHAQQEDIERAFGLSREGVRLAVELYEAMGVDGFYPDKALFAALTKPRAPSSSWRRKGKVVKGRWLDPVRRPDAGECARLAAARATVLLRIQS